MKVVHIPRDKVVHMYIGSRRKMRTTSVQTLDMRAKKDRHMNDPKISRRVQHRWQVASQRGSGTVSLAVPTNRRTTSPSAPPFAHGSGLPIRGLSRTRVPLCSRGLLCARLGPHTSQPRARDVGKGKRDGQPSHQLCMQRTIQATSGRPRDDVCLPAQRDGLYSCGREA